MEKVENRMESDLNENFDVKSEETSQKWRYDGVKNWKPHLRTKLPTDLYETYPGSRRRRSSNFQPQPQPSPLSQSQHQQAVDLRKGEKPMRSPKMGALKRQIIADVAAATPPIDENSAAESHAISILDKQQTDYEQQPPLKQISTDNVSRGKINIERIILATNFLIEIPSAIFDQISSKHKPIYALVVMLMSFMVTLLSIIELVYKARKERVLWRWEKSKLPWFFHPSPTNKRFGTFPEIVGLVCAILQSIVSAIVYGLYLHHADNPIKISFWPIIFSLGLFCSKFMGSK